MNKKEATKKINDILEKIKELTQEATDIADEHGISFVMEMPASAFSYGEKELVTYRPGTNWEPSACEWETSGYSEPGEWEWHNSSLNC